MFQFQLGAAAGPVRPATTNFFLRSIVTMVPRPFPTVRELSDCRKAWAPLTAT